MKVKLGDLIEEYSERNADNKYKPVAVGKYGIRARESIYSKELAKDYSKNKLIYKGTLTIGMGSNQIDIGILRDDEIYSVSPAYHTYNIKISNYDYLDYLLAANNNRMFSIYANRGSRQGKTLDLKRWLTDELHLHDEKDQKIIVQTLNAVKQLISQKEAELVKLDNLIKARFVEIFNMESYPIKPLSEIAEYWNGLTYKPSDVSSDGIIVLRSSNIQDMQLDLNDIVRVKCKINNKKMVKTNDILMCSRNGSAKLVGKVALIPELEETMSFGAFMMIIRSAYYPYLMTYFQLPVFRSQISTGTTTINQITRYMLDKVSLPVPDMAKIKEFKTFVTQVDKSKFVLSNELTMCGFYIRLIHDRVMHSCINLRVAQ